MVKKSAKKFPNKQWMIYKRKVKFTDGYEAIFSTIELKAYDIIELGVTKFIFVHFCGKEIPGEIAWIFTV